MREREPGDGPKDQPPFVHLQIVRGASAYSEFQPDPRAPDRPELLLARHDRGPVSLYQAPVAPPLWRRALKVAGPMALLGLAIGFAFSPELRQALPGHGQALPSAVQVAFVTETVVIDVVVSPASARLFIDGEPVTSNPIRVARDGRLHRLMGLADGHKPAEVVFSPDTDQRLRMKLRRRTAVR